MKAPVGVDSELVTDSSTEDGLLKPAILRGRSFASMDWYVEPKRFEQAPYPASPSGSAVRIARSDEPVKSLDTIAATEPPGYYVIVGFGASATVNHTTLRQSKKGWDRIARSPVVHVGLQDPWRHYRSHLMGQIANLLCVPGYHYSPEVNGENLLEPRVSSKMAEDTLSELHRLNRFYPFGEIAAWVAAIQSKAKNKPTGKELAALKVDLGGLWGKCESLLDSDFPAKYPPFRLLLIDTGGTPRLLYAEKIDLCVGNGRPRISIPKRVDATDTYGAKPWNPPECWPESLRRRTVLSGLEALCEETVWNQDCVCIMGSGGVGVNMVEIAQEERVRADWLATGTTHLDSFFNPRNDPLLKAWFVPADPKDPFAQATEIEHLANVSNAPLALGGLPAGPRKNVNALLVPAHQDFRFMQRTWIDDAPGLAQDNCPVSLALSRSPDDARRADLTDVPTLGIDSAGRITTISAGAFPYPDHSVPVYKRVILCSGQNPGASGQPGAVTKTLASPGVVDGPEGRLVGLSYENGLVRVLGASGTANEELIKASPGGEDALKLLRDFAATIPAQAGGPGNLALFALNCLNVAYANGFFTTERPNSNVNMATQKELESMTGDADLAKKICDARKASANGFQNAADLIDKIISVWPEAAIKPARGTVETKIKPLNYVYPRD